MCSEYLCIYVYVFVVFGLSFRPKCIVQLRILLGQVTSGAAPVGLATAAVVAPLANVFSAGDVSATMLKATEAYLALTQEGIAV